MPARPPCKALERARHGLKQSPYGGKGRPAGWPVCIRCTISIRCPMFKVQPRPGSNNSTAPPEHLSTLQRKPERRGKAQRSSLSNRLRFQWASKHESIRTPSRTRIDRPVGQALSRVSTPTERAAPRNRTDERLALSRNALLRAIIEFRRCSPIINSPDMG